MAEFDPNAAAKPGSGIFGLTCTQEESRVIVFPIPFAPTVSYREGAHLGPDAVLKASHQVDLFDSQVGEPWRVGIHYSEEGSGILERHAIARRLALQVIEHGEEFAGDVDLEKSRQKLRRDCEFIRHWSVSEIDQLLRQKKTVFTLGGDHSVSLGPIEAHLSHFPEMGVLQIDAHCDLRPAFEGITYSHASVFWNVMQQTGLKRLVQVGVRDFAGIEMATVREMPSRIKTSLWDDAINGLLKGTRSWARYCRRIVDELPNEVYISCDIDGLDPSLCPHTGTPVPGGISFDQFCYLIRDIVESGRRIVGGDLVEVAPGPPGDDWDTNVGSRVLYKMIGYALKSQGIS